MSKASERLFETNFCVDLALRTPGKRLVFLSPSQVREKKLGYDTLLQHSYGAEIIQFKVPKHELKRPRSAGGTPCLRVEFPHHQVVAMRKRSRRSRFARSHFVFPRAIRIKEYFDAGWDVLGLSYTLDASLLGVLTVPRRASGVHLGDFRPSNLCITLHSEPVELAVAPAAEAWQPSARPIGREGARELLEIFEGLDLELPTARVGIYLPMELQEDERAL